MKKNALSVMLAVLLTATVFGGSYYAAVVRPMAKGQPGETTWTTLKPSDGSSPTTPDERVGSPTQPLRTDKIIKCHDPQIGDFYTNAATCEGADLRNRMSYSESMPINPGQAQYGNPSYQSPANQAANSRVERGTAKREASEKPNLRLHGKAPPAGLPPECKFPVGKALEIERSLSAADDPFQSKWRESYCEFRCEARKERCPISEDYFYYAYGRMCRDTAHEYCS